MSLFASDAGSLSAGDNTAPRQRGRAWLILGASLFALGAGLVCARTIRLETLDSDRYRRLADSLATRGAFSACAHVPAHPEIQRVPGYPVFLVILRSLGVRSNHGVAKVQAVLHAIAVLAIARLAPRYPAATAWIFAVYPYSWYMNVKIMAEGLSEILLLLALVCIAQSASTPAWRRGLMSLGGLFLAALSLTRPVFLFLPLCIGAGALAWRWRVGPLQWSRRELALLVVCGILPLVPWAVRTSRVAGRPMPLALNYIGYNMWLATWDYRASSSDLETRLLDPRDPRNLGVTYSEECDPAKNLAESDHARRIAVARIRQDPVRYLLECLWRTIRIWLTWEITEPGVEGFRYLSLLLRYSSAALLALGIAGAWLVRREAVAVLTLIVPIVYVSAIHSIMHVSGRYSHPARGLLIALAVSALGAAVAALHRRGRPEPARSIAQ